jgi:small subunit ribosomal protein S15
MVKAKTLEEKYPKPVWLKMTEGDLKKLVLELSEKYQPAQIGLILRDQYGVPTTKVFGKKLSAYLREAGKNEFFEVKNIEKKVAKIKEHMKNNGQDKKAKHKFQKANSRLNALKKYSATRKQN